MKRPKPVVLVILDGWGVAPSSPSNAISLAKTPNIDQLIKSFPATTLQSSGEAVGLSWGELGNSEVGHLNIGVGRVFYQDLPRITRAVMDGSFFKNAVLIKAIDSAKKKKSKLHLLGLVSNGGIHSSNEHLYALLELAKKKHFKEVYIHVILDGRDTPYNSGLDFVKKLKLKIKELRVGKIATVGGRYWAMDRDNRWNRIERAYRAMVFGESQAYFFGAEEAIRHFYNQKKYDEEMPPVVIGKEGAPLAIIEDNDSVIFFNFRADRARQLTKTFVLPGFEKFARSKYFKNLFFVSMTEYDKDLPVSIAFPTQLAKETIAKIISDHHLKQLHIAETEKYAHVTYFFNGGQEEPFMGEKRILIPSLKISAYDQKPEMRAKEITTQTVKAAISGEYDFIVVNYANPDMIGHTGNLKATIKTIEIVDRCVSKVVEAVLSQGGVVLITADHGNAEVLKNLRTNSQDKEHNNSPVPFIVVGAEYEGKIAGMPESVSEDLSLVTPQGILADVGPTILKIMNLKIPKEMTGRSLI